MVRFNLFLMAVFAVTAAFGQPVRDSLLIEGLYRSFTYNDAKSAEPGGSLVFVMHGSMGRAEDMMKAAAKLDQLARSQHAVVVYPNGYKRFWNECRRMSPAETNKLDVNEQAFFRGMIEYFQRRYGIDSRKVFAVGTSGGGHMAYKLALTMPETFRAVTAIIANLPDSANMDCVPAGKPVPVMIVNGTDDRVNPYEGGEVNIGFSLGHVRSTEKTFRYWAGLAGYTGEPLKETLPNTNPGDGKTIERYTFRQPHQPEVTLLKVVGGKHDYPGDIDVHVEAWKFFQRQINLK